MVELEFKCLLSDVIGDDLNFFQVTQIGTITSEFLPFFKLLLYFDHALLFTKENQTSVRPQREKESGAMTSIAVGKVTVHC